MDQNTPPIEPNNSLSSSNTEDASPLVSTPPKAPSTPDKPKSSKKLIIILSVLFGLSLVAAGVFAVLYFTNNNKTDDTSNNTENDTPTHTVVNEEVELTDTNVISDLNKKIALLLNIEETDDSLHLTGIGQYDGELFHNGDISQSDKVRSLISYDITQRPLTEQEISAAIAQIGIDAENEQYFRQYNTNGVSGDTVVQKYLEVYGETIGKGSIENICGEYEYNSQYDFYFTGALGCGGTTPYERYLYKNRFTADNDHAYVYVSTAVTSPDDATAGLYHVYCDIADLESTQIAAGAKECATLSTLAEKDSFSLNSSNYEPYTEYRFVFNKSEDGNYFFDKVEKVNS